MVGGKGKVGESSGTVVECVGRDVESITEGLVTGVREVSLPCET